MKIFIVLIAAFSLWACQRPDYEPVGERTDETAEERADPRADARPEEGADEQMGRADEYAGERHAATEEFVCEGQLSRIVLEDDDTAVVTTDTGPQEARYELEGDELSISLPDGESLEFMVQGDTIEADEDTRCQKVG